jgi:hypothetical protein
MSGGLATRVEISFFKPAGFSDAYVCMTDDRGAAARAVIGRFEYTAFMPCLNYLTCNLIGEQEAQYLIDSKRAQRVEPMAAPRNDAEAGAVPDSGVRPHKLDL